MTMWTFPEELKARIVPLEGAHNFRDLGGWATGDGRHVRSGRIYRSAALSTLTPQDHQQLAALGFSDVVDLRSEYEQTRHPTHWPDGNRRALWAKAGGESAGNLMRMLESPQGRSGGLRDAMIEVYHRIPVALAPAFRHILQTLLQERDALLFHCAAGKDRTGVASAILLKTLGVDEDQIRLDYLLTNASYETLLGRFATDYDFDRIEAHEPGTVKMLFGAHAEFLEASFAVIDRDYGSFEGYLRDEMGIDDAARARLQGLLLE